MACIIDSCVPTASMTECAPSPPVSSLIRAAPSSPRSATMSVAPNSWASRWRDSCRLIAMIRSALLGGEHREQADGAVADDRHRLAWTGLGRHGAKPAGAEHVGGREQAGDQVLRRQARRRYEGAVSERDAGVLCLCAGGGTGLPVDAGRLVASPADLAGVVGGEERADDELARLDQTYLTADLLDDADVLVAHRCRLRHRVGPAVGPEVRAAHAGDRQSDDGVGRLDDRRVRALLETHVAGAVHYGRAHSGLPPISGGLQVIQSKRCGRFFGHEFSPIPFLLVLSSAEAGPEPSHIRISS